MNQVFRFPVSKQMSKLKMNLMYLQHALNFRFLNISIFLMYINIDFYNEQFVVIWSEINKNMHIYLAAITRKPLEKVVRSHIHCYWSNVFIIRIQVM